MSGLYDRLAEQNPAEWGPASYLGKYSLQFQQDFEKTYSQVVIKEAPFTRDTLTLLEHLRPLALYFSQFILDGTRLDFYSQLLSVLMRSGKLQRSVFGSLNFDSLLEQAAVALGLRVDYRCNEIDHDVIRVAKVHGACTFVTRELSQHQQAMLAAPGAQFEDRVNFLSPIHLQETLREKFRLGCLPIISEISPQKENLFAPRTIRQIRWKWQEALSGAAFAAVIGVSYNQYDNHIVEAIAKLAVPIFYIGGNRDFENWHALNGHFEHIAETLEGGLTPLLDKF